MRIYFDERGRERRVYARRSRNERSAAEKRADERAARAAFVNDECVVTRGGKLRGALEYERVAHAGLSWKKKEIRPRVATPSLNPRKFSRDSGARERDVVSQALYVRYAAGYRMKFYISCMISRILLMDNKRASRYIWRMLKWGGYGKEKNTEDSTFWRWRELNRFLKRVAFIVKLNCYRGSITKNSIRTAPCRVHRWR